jgi:TonB-linked SusC/RagA family outer membrane protein
MSVGFARVTRRAFAAASLGLVASTAVVTAQTGTIRGRVSEAASQRPVADAQVTVAGTTLGAATNANGQYVLTNVPAGNRELVVRRLGYARRSQTVTVPAGGEGRADFTLSPTASQLEAVVVTGTVGAAERRTVGNAVTQLDVRDIAEKATVTTVSEVLQARSPGVTVQAGAGTPGAASEITIRGYGSFTNNRPVVFIDGIRIDTEALGNFAPSGAGTTGFSGQQTSGLDQVNPQDIESIEVIKGPAAATLYGADAAGGVIQIITKKGQRGQQPLRWNTRVEMGRNGWGTETLVNYATCTQARIDLRDAAGNPTWPGCQGVAPGTVLTDEPLRNRFYNTGTGSDTLRRSPALRDGDVRRLSMSMRGGGDRYAYYISAETDQNQGVFFNSHDDRRSVRSNFTLNPTNILDLNLNIGYIRSRLRLPVGDEAANGLLLSAARGIPGLARSNVRLTQNGWGTLEPDYANRYNNQTTTDRLTLASTANYNPFPWLRNRVTAGFDFRSTLGQLLSLPGDPDTPTGLNAQRRLSVWNYTVDYAGTAVANITSDIESMTSVGTQLTSRREQTLFASGTQLPTPEVTTIGSALSRNASDTLSEFNQVGVFVQEQLGWKNRLFVTGAVRADDHSSFGRDFDIIVYPKASVSYVASEEPALERWFRMARAQTVRFRGAWGQAGRAPAPYAASQTYTSMRVATGTGVAGGIRTNVYGNPNLKPEKGEEIELGFDADFLQGRIGTEFTYYSKKMRDLLVPLALPPSLGFSGSQLQNLGSTRNSGIELGINATPLDLRNVVWESRVSLSSNKNRLLSLDTIRVCKPWLGETTCPAGRSPAEELVSGASYSPAMQRNRVGYPLGSWFLRYPARDAQGNVQFTRTTAGVLVPVYETEFRYAGPALPTRMISFSNTLTLFRSWQLYTLLDFQGGHKNFNYKEYNRCALVSNGPNCERLNRPGISEEEAALYGTGGGTPTVLTSPMTQTLYVEKADFVKLRDVSLTYTLPPRFAQRGGVESAAITVSGRNLALWTDYTGLDPEVNGYSNNLLRGSGASSQFARVDAYSNPMMRRYTVTLNVTY